MEKVSRCPKCGSEMPPTWTERSMDGNSQCSSCNSISPNAHWVSILPKPTASPAAQVFVGIPCYGDKVNAAMVGQMLTASPKGQLARLQSSALSLLPHNFNRLYAQALNERPGITHFCLVHADIIIKTKGWLDKMLEIMEREHAHILSVVSPIKDKRGITSTAIDNGTWEPKRLTMTEIMARPETFTEKGLLVNSACMLVDIQNFSSTLLYFEFKDAIIPTKDGYAASVFPEDWGFSRKAHEYNRRVFATREIELEHIGTHRYSNQFAWGTEK